MRSGPTSSDKKLRPRTVVSTSIVRDGYPDPVFPSEPANMQATNNRRRNSDEADYRAKIMNSKLAVRPSWNAEHADVVTALAIANSGVHGAKVSPSAASTAQTYSTYQAPLALDKETNRSEVSGPETQGKIRYGKSAPKTTLGKDVEFVPSYSNPDTEELQPGFEFVSWGEYGPPERPQEPMPRSPAATSNESKHSNFSAMSMDSDDDIATEETKKLQTGSCAKADPRWFLSRRVLCAGLLIIVLAVGGAIVGIVVMKPKSSSGATQAPTVTTQMDPPTVACDSWNNQIQPNVITQCLCIGKITTIADDIKSNYQQLKTGGFIQSIIPGFASTMESCDPVNQALLWLASATGSSASGENYRQRFLMALLFVTWNGRLWTLNDGWLTSNNECAWKGVICNRFGEVTGVNLYNNQVTGLLGTSFSLLTRLDTLSLGQNGMHGSLPSELGSVESLTSLDFESNELTGSIPNSLVRLSLLQELSLGNNKLSGTIPTWLGQLTNLQVLALSNNTFTNSGVGNAIGVQTAPSHKRNAFPSEFGLLTNLQYLELSSIRLNGTIPTEIFKLGATLERFVLTGSSISGTISSLFGDLASLCKLSVPHWQEMSKICIALTQ